MRVRMVTRWASTTMGSSARPNYCCGRMAASSRSGGVRPSTTISLPSIFRVCRTDLRATPEAPYTGNTERSEASLDGVMLRSVSFRTIALELIPKLPTRQYVTHLRKLDRHLRMLVPPAVVLDRPGSRVAGRAQHIHARIQITLCYLT